MSNSCDWWTVAHQAPLSMGFSRQKHWSGLLFPSPGDLPSPGIEPGLPAPQADSLPTELPAKPWCCITQGRENPFARRTRPAAWLAALRAKITPSSFPRPAGPGLTSDLAETRGETGEEDWSSYSENVPQKLSTFTLEIAALRGPG